MDSSRKKELIILLLINIIAIAQMLIWDANEPLILGLIIVITIVNGLYFGYFVKKITTSFIQTKKNLGYRVENVGSYVFSQVPLGILLYDASNKVVWSNPYAKQIFKKDFDGLDISNLDSELFGMVASGKKTFEFSYNDYVYLVKHSKEGRVLYFDDITSYAKLMTRYEDEKSTLGIIVLDNYDEVVKNLDEQAQNDYRRAITDKLAGWASENGILFRQLRDSRHIIITSNKILNRLCSGRFSILDDIRKIGTGDVVLTVSMGIASGYDSYIASFNRASSLVDLALSRGGDQVVVKKKGNDDFLFYGGKTNPVASQNRVRARVSAGAYERMILESDNVVVMGHRFPDADAIGASIGLLKIATTFGKNGYIVLNKNELDKANEVFINEILKDAYLAPLFVSSDKAANLMTKNSLLVIADTQNKSLVIDNKLLQLTNKTAIFDHHRRSADFIESTFSYTDPSVSSTSELIVDMFDYFSKRITLTAAEASIMLSGIMLDTRRFMYNTSKKTYEAAAILKQRGADEKYVARLLKAPIEHYYSRAHLTHRARVFEEVYLVSAATGELIFDRTEIAATADDLLNVQGIKATFVIGLTAENEVAISARSIGDVNVQLIMETLGGGGHLTNAAAKFIGTVDEATQALEAAVREFDS